MHDRACAEEGTDLHKRVAHHMRHRPHHSCRSHHRSAQDNIRQITDRRICQPPLDMLLFDRPAAAIDNRKHRKPHHDRLYPCAFQKFRAKAVIGQSQNGKHTGFHHRHSMKQCRNRGGRHASLRKPRTHWENGRFHAKSEKCQQIYE